MPLKRSDWLTPPSSMTIPAKTISASFLCLLTFATGQFLFGQATGSVFGGKAGRGEGGAVTPAPDVAWNGRKSLGEVEKGIKYRPGGLSYLLRFRQGLLHGGDGAVHIFLAMRSG